MLKRSDHKQSKNADHPIAVGETVTVISLDQSGVFIDGIATINGRAQGAHCYSVTFVGDRRTRQRVVHPIVQRNALAIVEWLRALQGFAAVEDPDEFHPPMKLEGE